MISLLRYCRLKFITHKVFEWRLSIGKASKTLFCTFLEGVGIEFEDCYGTFKKLLRNSEYSESDDFKKLPVPVQILSFLYKLKCINVNVFFNHFIFQFIVTAPLFVHSAFAYRKFVVLCWFLYGWLNFLFISCDCMLFLSVDKFVLTPNWMLTGLEFITPKGVIKDLNKRISWKVHGRIWKQCDVWKQCDANSFNYCVKTCSLLQPLELVQSRIHRCSYRKTLLSPRGAYLILDIPEGAY